MENKIGLIGNGSWATAIAKILTDNGHAIYWWMRNESAKKNLEINFQNSPYLSSITFPSDKIYPTNDIDDVLNTCDIIIFCVPSAYLKDILQQIHVNNLENKLIISAIKGLIPDEYMLLNDYLIHQYQLDTNNYIAITGPCHAEEIALERLSYLTFSCHDIENAKKVASLFNNQYLRTVTNSDTNGSQYAAILKNIYAVGAGIAHGLGYGDNFISVYVTNCYNELFHFVNCNNASAEPFLKSAYLGDLLVTCYSLHSRNRRFGTLLGKGYSIQAAITEMGMMAEGYFAAKGINEIVNRQNHSLPIVESIYEILWGNKTPGSVFKNLEKIFE